MGGDPECASEEEIDEYLKYKYIEDEFIVYEPNLSPKTPDLFKQTAIYGSTIPL